jgi:xanthine dehydrogenase accessory factor
MNQNKQPIAESEVYQTLARMAAANEDGILVTVVRTRLSTPRHEGSKMVVHPDGSVTGSVGGGRSEARVIEEAMQVLVDRRCRILELDLAKGLGVCGGNMEVFLEPVLRSAPFIVIGAGHVGRAMVEVGQALPFHFILVDDRPEFLESWQGNAAVQTILSTPEDLAGKLNVSNRAALLLASRTHELDTAYLESILRSEMDSDCVFPFLGVLGSRSKALRIHGRICALGEAFAQRMDHVQMPVGLDIGAETPSEIALSVFAEAQAVLRGVKPLRGENGEIIGVPLHRNRKPKSNPDNGQG